MLFFICTGIGFLDQFQLYLNTSHVILYHKHLELSKEILQNLNTSHVILYPSLTDRLSAGREHLNTSHVILYQSCVAFTFDGSEFKYISCYSLSVWLTVPNAAVLYLNTSHVILYLTCPLSTSIIFYHLNTSHVILYLNLDMGIFVHIYLNTSHVILYQK